MAKIKLEIPNEWVDTIVGALTGKAQEYEQAALDHNGASEPMKTWRERARRCRVVAASISRGNGRGS